MNKVLVFISVLVSLVILDLLWVGVIGKNLYRTQLVSFLRPNFNFASIVVVYLLLTIGIIILVLNNPFSTSVSRAALIGAILGLVVYGVYEFTNFGIIKDWPMKIVIIDTIWGIVICGVGSVVGKLVSNV